MNPSGFTNLGTSIVTDSVGVPHLAYSLRDSYDLKYGFRRASAWHTEVVAPRGGGLYVSLKLDSIERPRIAYMGPGPGLWYASRDDASWTAGVVDAGPDCGGYASLALDSQDRPRIAYLCGNQLRHVFWDGTRWVDVSPRGPTGAPVLADSVSLALDPGGGPRMAYYGVDSGQLMHAYGGAPGWALEVVDANVNLTRRGTSIAIDRSGTLHISYVDEDAGLLKYAVRAGIAWTIEVVDAAVAKFCQGHYGSALALDSSGSPRIAYFICRNGERSLGYAWRDGTWSYEVADSQGPTGAQPSLAIDAYDFPHIAYLNHVAGYVKYAFIPRPDREPPLSHVLPMSPYWNAPAIEAAVVDFSDVANVTLWYRHSTDNATWAAWTVHAVANSPPWAWIFSHPRGEGFYEFYSTAVDVFGNEEPPPATADAITGYDVTPPVSTSAPVTPYWHETPPIGIDATADDELSGVAAVGLRYTHAPDNASWKPWTDLGILVTPPWSWTFPFPDGEGHYRFHAVASDLAGNSEVGKTAPETIAGYRVTPDYAPSNPSPVGPFTVGLSASVTLSLEVANLGGDANATGALVFANGTAPGSPFATFPIPALRAGDTAGPFPAPWRSPSTPGTYGILARVDSLDAIPETDETNNEHRWTVTVVSGPVTTLRLGEPNVTGAVPFVTSATPLALSVLDAGGTGIRSTTYRVDRGGWTPYAGPFALALEGEHLVEWSSEDNAGNVEAVRSQAVRVDDTPPETVLAVGYPSYLEGGVFVTSTTPLILAAEDGGAATVGLARTEYSVDASPWIPFGPSFTLAGDGAHGIEFRSFDQLGNVEPVRRVAVVLDDTPPSLAPAVGDPNHAGGSVYVTSETAISVAAVDQGAIPVGLASLEVRINAGGLIAFSGPFSLPPPDGPKRVEYAAADRLGNRNTAILDLVLDDTPPHTSLSPAAGPYTAETVFTLSASDEGSGVRRTEYRVDRGPWRPYDGGFSLSIGDHVIRYRSSDSVNNTESDRETTVAIDGPMAAWATNWKPVVAAVFSALLAAVGAWSVRRRAQMSPASRATKGRVFAITALPFVVAEGTTGFASLLTGVLAIPPLLGAGMIVDIGILVAGLAVILRSGSSRRVHAPA